jgi:hypothetical protein
MTDKYDLRLMFFSVKFLDTVSDLLLPVKNAGRGWGARADLSL